MLLLQSVPSWFRGIDAIDRKLFFIVNNSLSNRFFDSIMPFVRESTIWAPLYLFMLVLVLANFGKRGWLWALFFICTVGLCDMISSHIIKETIFRLRPCNNPELTDRIRVLVNYRPQSSSFTSSHATNHFGMAVFMVMTLRQFFSPWIRLVYLWAAVIAFAQVYVGVHYPFDVLAGALIGSFVGYIMARFFNNYAGFISLQNKLA